jgi:putative transposase
MFSSTAPLEPHLDQYDDLYKPYAHAPGHLFRAGGVYFVTAATYDHAHHLHNDHRKRQWQDALGFVARREHWRLGAWVVLSNHYHILLHAPASGAARLPHLLRDMHKFLAHDWNRTDGAAGRAVWRNYWDTCIDSERSYYARVNYVHWNPVKHGLVTDPLAYAFSSYRLFVAMDSAQVQQMESQYPWDQLRFPDDY